jgi:hypothetical protein
MNFKQQDTKNKVNFPVRIVFSTILYMLRGFPLLYITLSVTLLPFAFTKFRGRKREHESSSLVKLTQNCVSWFKIPEINGEQ